MEKQRDNLQLKAYMEAAQQGDKAAYTRLLQEIAPIIRGYVAKRINISSDVEDITQEILISVHKARHTYDVDRPFVPWLMAIVKFRLIDYLRKIYRRDEHESAAPEDLLLFAEDNENVTETGIRGELLHEAMEKLPEKQREILDLIHNDGYTSKEVGERLGMSVSAVKVTAHRTYKKLRTIIEDQEKHSENG